MPQLVGGKDLVDHFTTLAAKVMLVELYRALLTRVSTMVTSVHPQLFCCTNISLHFGATYDNCHFGLGKGELTYIMAV